MITGEFLRTGTAMMSMSFASLSAMSRGSLGELRSVTASARRTSTAASVAHHVEDLARAFLLLGRQVHRVDAAADLVGGVGARFGAVAAHKAANIVLGQGAAHGGDRHSGRAFCPLAA